ncbi:MAG: DUF3160 domain-containing protein [Candidatus Hodarchaeales archaeon]|jgi:hypothetical protein
MGLDDATRKSIFRSSVIALTVAFAVVGGSFLGSIIFFATEENGFLPGHPTTGLFYTIEGPVDTSFSRYEPYSIDIGPSLQAYPFYPGLATNYGEFQFNSEEQELLTRNGFFATPTEYGQFYDLYADNFENTIPSFVTTDSVLHTFHIIYDYLLREIESYNLTAELVTLVDLMLEWHQSANDSLPAGVEKVEAAMRKNIAYFSVAKKLLQPNASISVAVEELVNAELALIDNHAGLAYSPIFGSDYLEDYSQYVPRGHYDRSATLQQYFKAMMWFGHISFHLQPGEDETAKERGYKETRQALLITLALNQALNGSTTALALWDRIYEPTAFFVGTSDDLTIYDYLDILDETLGQIEGLSTLESNSAIQLFIAEALTRRSPLIRSSFIPTGGNVSLVTKGFRFMGQRLVPDSYIFQELVHDTVPTRMFPKGLDVMSVFGSAQAAAHLTDQESYENYLDQVQKLRNQFGNTTDADWTQNLYWLWLYSLFPLLNQKGEGYPTFMQTDAWSDKELYTALGSWTELRHDTILYAKETLIPLSAKEPMGYVEPNPHLYGRLASLAEMMKLGVSERGLLSPLMEDRLDYLVQTLQRLREISEKELQGESLDHQDLTFILHFQDRLKMLVAFPTGVGYQSVSDERIAVVADVHTEPNSGNVLEEGVGDVLALYVLVRDADGKFFIARGGMFSYYEFTWPMSDRLTDGAWQDMLDAGTNPLPPSWTTSFSLHDN